MRTSLYGLLCIVIRLGAVLLAFNMLASVVNMVLSWYENVPVGEVAYTIGFVAITLLIAFLLWLYPGPLARMAAGRSAQQIFETPLEARDLQWIAMSILGMYFVMSGLIGLGGYAFNRLLMSGLIDQTSDEVRRRVIADYLYWVIQIGLGAALAFGARGLVGLLRGFRERGLAAPPMDDMDRSETGG